MAHWSEDAIRLSLVKEQALVVSDIEAICGKSAPEVYLFWFPAGRTDNDGALSSEVFRQFAHICGNLHPESVVCVLTTPPDAARLLPFLEKVLRFQLWVAVKVSDGTGTEKGSLPAKHAALLVLTRYRAPLRHTKTRIQYTYCPACHKTTKDYGGKKHVYHEYGTLMSDVWRDIEIDPSENIEPVVSRLRDVFGLPPYTNLRFIDLRRCTDLLPQYFQNYVSETCLQFTYDELPYPLESRLINADCLEAIRTIPDNSVDFCFADPPYNLRKKYDHWDDDIDSIRYFEWCDQWLSELARVLKPGKTLAVLNIPLWAVRHYQHLAKILRFQTWIVWDALSFPVRMIMPSHYAILCFSKGVPRPLPGIVSPVEDEMEYLTPLAEGFCLRADCVRNRRLRNIDDSGELSDVWYDIHRLKHNAYRVDHPCQLPPLLMRRLFALFTKPGELILDCFNGAGTSTLVAHQMGRRFIGIEISRKYHEIAVERHAQIARGDDPFAKRGEVPVAKNSPVPRLPKQRYVVSKKALQMEVKRVAQIVGHLPSREEVKQYGRYPIELYDRYFISWGEACAAARTTGMSELPPNYGDRSFQFQLHFDE